MILAGAIRWCLDALPTTSYGMARGGQGDPIRSFRDLIVWQKAMQLRRLLYAIVRGLPPEERYALGLQMRKVSVSVPSTIAEGHARQARKDYRQYLSMARGSLAEIATQLEVAKEEHYVDAEAFKTALALTDEVSRMTTSIMRKLSH